MVGWKKWAKKKRARKNGRSFIFPSSVFSRPFSLRPFFLTRHLFKNPQNLQ
jgi:hypothetical protein